MQLNDSDSIMNESYYYADDSVILYNESATSLGAPALCTDVACVFLSMVNVMIVLLGVVGNSMVIWITGFKIKKTVNTVWYLSLAVSDFLFCAFLPVSVAYVITRNWAFGTFMCKFTSFVLSLNMFSSIFLLLVISMDRCVVVMFPVWAQNNRTTPRALGVVLTVWFMSVLLSLPAAIFRDIHEDFVHSKQTCFENYPPNGTHLAVVVCRFLFGFLIPFLIIASCYVVIIRKLRNNKMPRSNKPFKVMTALILALFFSWMPYHFFKLLEVNFKDQNILRVGQIVGTVLASANSCMNPLLYALMGKDFKKKCYKILSKMESTFEEEARSSRQGTSVTNVGDGILSSHV